MGLFPPQEPVKRDDVYIPQQGDLDIQIDSPPAVIPQEQTGFISAPERNVAPQITYPVYWNNIIDIPPCLKGDICTIISNFQGITIGVPANGLSISGNTLSISLASATDIGVVSISAQTFSGEKTFNGGLVSSVLKAINSAGVTIQNSTGQSVMLLGAGGSQGVTLYGQMNSHSIVPVTTNTYDLGTISELYRAIYGTNIYTSLGSAAAPSISYVGDTDTGTYSPTANQWAVSTGGIQRILSDNNGLTTITGKSLTSAEAFGSLLIRQTWNTTGTPTGVLVSVTDTASNSSSLLLDLRRNGVSVFRVRKDGQVIGVTDIQSSGSLVAGTNVLLGGTITFTGKSKITSTVDSNIILSNNAGTDFSILIWNSASVATPALKRNGTGLQVRLGNDSAFSTIETLYSRFGSGTPEGVVTAPIGAIYSRTDGGAATSLYVKESGTGNTGWVAK